MQMNLDGKKRVWLGFILAAAAVVYLGVALRSVAAQMLGRFEDPQAWQRAAWLEPGNATYPYQLGRYAILQDRDASSAANYFEAAVARNPHEARNWVPARACNHSSHPEKLGGSAHGQVQGGIALLLPSWCNQGSIGRARNPSGLFGVGKHRPENERIPLGSNR